MITANSQFSRCDFNVFDRLKLTGAPAYVISGGHVVFDAEGVSVMDGSREKQTFIINVKKLKTCISNAP